MADPDTSFRKTRCGQVSQTLLRWWSKIVHMKKKKKEEKRSPWWRTPRAVCRQLQLDPLNSNNFFIQGVTFWGTKTQTVFSRLRLSCCKESCHYKRICTNYIKYVIKQCSENNRLESQKVNKQTDPKPLPVLNSHVENAVRMPGKDTNHNCFMEMISL